MGVEKKGVFEGIGEELSKEIPGFEAFTNAAQGAAGKVAVAALAVKEGIDFVKESVTEFAAAQVSQFKIDAALAQTGNLTRETRMEIDALIREMKEATGVSGTEWAATITRLVQFGSDPGKLKEYAEGVKNLAAVMGGDVESAGHVFVRAIEGNYEALRRYGIKIEETGTSTERMERLMSELALRGGGQMEARAQTMTGKWDRLKETFHATMIPVGGLAAKMFEATNFTEGWTTALDWLEKKLHGVVAGAEGLENAARKTKQSFDDLDEAAKRLQASLGVMDELAGDADKAADQRIAALKRETAAVDELAEAAKRLEIAKIKGRLAAGELTPEQAGIGIARIEEASEHGKNARKVGLAAEVEKINKAEKDDADKQVGAAVQRREKAENEAQKAKQYAALKAELEHNEAIVRFIEESRNPPPGTTSGVFGEAGESLEQPRNAERDKRVSDMAKRNAEEARRKMSALGSPDSEIRAAREEVARREEAVKMASGPDSQSAKDAMYEARRKLREFGPAVKDVGEADAAVLAAKQQEDKAREISKKATDKYLPAATAAREEAEQARKVEAINQRTREAEYKEKFIHDHSHDGGDVQPAGSPDEALGRYRQDNQAIDRLVHAIVSGNGNQRTVALLERAVADMSAMGKRIQWLEAEQKKTSSQFISGQSFR
jgi:hypothetical protein